MWRPANDFASPGDREGERELHAIGNLYRESGPGTNPIGSVGTTRARTRSDATLPETERIRDALATAISEGTFIRSLGRLELETETGTESL
jgi:hypothetical protein